MDQGQPLAGFTVALTVERPGDPAGARLERLGARVVRAPVGRFVPPVDDDDLRTATAALIDRPPTIVLDAAGTSLRGWLVAAGQWGLAESLRRALAGSRRVGTGRREPRAAGEPGPDPITDLLADLLAQQRPPGAAAPRVALHLLAGGYPELTEALTGAGADVVELHLHRWLPPVDTTPLRRVVDLATSRLLDAVVVGSAPAAGALLLAAGPDRVALLAALRGEVVVAAANRAAAGPLRSQGVPVVVPGPGPGGGYGDPPGSLDAVAALLARVVPARAPTLTVAGQRVTLRGHVAVVDGAVRPLAPGPMAVLRALAAVPGRVLSRGMLRSALPRTGDEHAVEMAVARLRAGLGVAGMVQTVAKRGYRLRVE